MALFCIISEIKRDVGRKSPYFYTPIHSTLPLGDLRQNIATPFGTEKLEWCGYPMKKKFKDMRNRFDRILGCAGQTHRRTDSLRQQSPRYA